MKIRLGTRGSQLALAQAESCKQALMQQNPSLQVELVPILTTGDRKQGTSAAETSDKQEWVHELERALLAREIDLAIHSGKDIPYQVANETVLHPVLPRVDPRDVFIGRQGSGNDRIPFASLPLGATIGTASLRRRAQLLHLRPDLKVVPWRGNVPTRIEKLANSHLSGVVLAAAGLVRLNRYEAQFEPFHTNTFLPAMNQGILVAQHRLDKPEIERYIQGLVDPITLQIWRAERTVAEVLQGDCQSAMAIYADVHRSQLRLQARVLATDGQASITRHGTADRDQGDALGRKIGQALIEAGAVELLQRGR